MRTLIITPCAGELSIAMASPAHVLALSEPGQEVSACPLVDVCSGAQHHLVRAGVEAVWERWGREVLDWAILSSDYGLLHAYEVVIPDEPVAGPSDTPGDVDWGAGLQIQERAALLLGEYDLAFYLLSGRDLAVLGLPLPVSRTVQQIILTDEESLALVPDSPHFHPFVADGWVAARRWHVKAPQVRGFLFRRLCDRVVRHGPVVLEWLYHHPGDTERLFYKRTRWRPQYRLWD